MLQACDRAAKHTEMVGLAQSMPKLGVEPNVVNYNTAIRALGRAGDLKRVAEMFSLMRSRGLEPEVSASRNPGCPSAESSHTSTSFVVEAIGRCLSEEEYEAGGWVEVLVLKLQGGWLREGGWLAIGWAEG